MRKSPRFPTSAKVSIEYNGNNISGKINDLSLHGAFIRLQPSSEVDNDRERSVVHPEELCNSSLGNLLGLKFSLQPNGKPMEVLAKVVRLVRHGIAVEFLDSDRQKQYLLWSSLTALWPKVLNTCPYCGDPLDSSAKTSCPSCLLPLEFQKDGYLDQLPIDQNNFREMIGSCAVMRELFRLIRKVAKSDYPVLITGPTGTGKEMTAQAIHQRGRSHNGPFVTVNCGAIPKELLESELFGHEKGAFTGAHKTVQGKVELAHGGTLFLDEVGELPLELQVKLLRFLQEFTFERVGGRETKKVDLRVIAATNSNLEGLISEGRYREDLFYRINVLNIHLPSLKDRGEDVLIMANAFLKRCGLESGKKLLGFTPAAKEAILSYHWPGNVRELINLIRRAAVMAEGTLVTPEDLGIANGEGSEAGLKEVLARIESKLVREALIEFKGNVNLAAKRLKTTSAVVYYLVKKHDLQDYTAAPLGRKQENLTFQSESSMMR